MKLRSFFLRKLKQVGKKLDFELINAADPAEVFSVLVKYRGSEGPSRDKEFAFVQFVMRNYSASCAQLFQDLFVLFFLGQKREGFFIEFGATNGVELSNTVLLEQSYDWDGILAEPAKCWHEGLGANRKCVIDTRCVWARSGEPLEFKQVPDRELSTITAFSGSDGHRLSREIGQTYLVETDSLNDLLAESKAPRSIDYLSVDTEGSEFEILRAFDFRKYEVRVLTVEHNFAPNRDTIHAHLMSEGFTRVFERFSMWDDWYIRQRSASLA
jgi:FkbM family methyltransferase